MVKTQFCGKVLETDEGCTGVDTGEDQRRQIGVRMDMTVPPCQGQALEAGTIVVGVNSPETEMWNFFNEVLK